MGGLLAAIAGLAVPMVARVLVALGFSVVSITGVAIAWSTVKGEIVSNLSAQAGAYVQLAGLGGVWVALGAIIGAMSFAVAFWGLTSAVRVMGAS